MASTVTCLASMPQRSSALRKKERVHFPGPDEPDGFAHQVLRFFYRLGLADDADRRSIGRGGNDHEIGTGEIRLHGRHARTLREL
jgi:hypothetical protein